MCYEPDGSLGQSFGRFVGAFPCLGMMIAVVLFVAFTRFYQRLPGEILKDSWWWASVGVGGVGFMRFHGVLAL